eukprot:TRINITY_DN19540_c1_g1_i1.p1 TRINITY_DN19540_c1_g1~~TRINITY_DN19540_c1_g1_i1.p1  ORF type:complete len:244 (-),score=42.17 TRINITY_DN19540_c1_g1_i1:14-745(-)
MEGDTTTVLCKVLLVRHGQAYHNLWDSNGKKQLHHFDPPLTEKGEADAREVFSKWEGFEFALAYVSPQWRALQTAHLALRQRTPTGQLPCPLLAHEDICELNDKFPCNHRRPMSQLRGEFPEVDWSLLEEHRLAPGLDSRETHQEEVLAVRARARRFLGFLEGRHAGGGGVVVFSHTWLIGGLLAVVEGLDDKTYYDHLPPGSSYEIELVRGSPEGDIGSVYWRLASGTSKALSRIKIPEVYG